MENKEKRGLPFGVRIRCGGFYLEKFTRGLSKSSLRALRSGYELKKGVRLPSDRGRLPFIRLSTLSGSWSMEWACTMGMFSLLDSLEVVGGVLTETSSAELRSLVTLLYTEGTVLGDAKFMKDRMAAFSSYVSRIVVSSPGADGEDGVLEEERLRHRTVENLKSMADEEQ